MKTFSWSVILVLLTVATADASTVKCERAIAKASAQFVQAKSRALSKCEGTIVKNGSGGPCPDAKAGTAITKATDKLISMIGKTCGGDDKVCGGDLTNEDLPATLGWPTACPNFERGACDGEIHDCGDIASCLTCLTNAAVDQAMELYYGDLLLPSTDDLNRCQSAIGRATSTFLSAKSKALRKCWDAKIQGTLAPAATCIAPDPGDGKYLLAIQKAEDKKKATICKLCGGPDRVCGGGDDLSPVTIGFPTTCPAVTIPGGAACGGPITDLDSLIACVDCVTEFKVDCVDRAQVPDLASYPSECNACLAPPGSGPCPTSVQYTYDGAHADVDLGWTGFAHDQVDPSNKRLTLAVSGCAGASQPTCGQCNVSGPIPNAGGITFDDQRCKDQPWVGCAADLDCTNAGASGPCVYFFGPPQPMVSGGIGSCVLNEINLPVTGTVNVEAGAGATVVNVAARIHLFGNVVHPCPTCSRLCVGGESFGLECSADTDCPGSTCAAAVCSDGPRASLPCAPQGSGPFGVVSLDCPPNPGAGVAMPPVELNLTTGVQVRTLTAANPLCRQTGYTTLSCFCSTCNTANAETCSTDAECPISGGNPGICGGKRCIGGGNEGAPCSVKSECPAGTCTRPGEPTQPNYCFDNTATPGLDCVDVGGNEGECAAGPFESVCSLEFGRACATTADCNPPPVGSCLDCQPDQTCTSKPLACFTDNGIVGNSVIAAGNAQETCGGHAKPTVGALFCLPPTAATLVNAMEGLPGLGRIQEPVAMQFLP